MPDPIPESDIAKWTVACEGPLIMPKQRNQFTAIARTAMPRLLAERTQLIEQVKDMKYQRDLLALNPGKHSPVVNVTDEQGKVVWVGLPEGYPQTASQAPVNLPKQETPNA